MSLLEPASNLRITNQQGPAANGDFIISFAWDLPSSLQGIDLIFFDIAIDSGFLNYVTQQPVQNLTSSTVALNSNPGRYWARVNTHYTDLGVRGWVSSNIFEIVLPGALPPANGTPASNLNLDNNILTWTPGSGLITREAVDISKLSDFGDILEAPFVIPINDTLIMDALPIACDMPLNLSQLTLTSVPDKPFYIRVNTLLENRTWIPSETISMQSMTPLLIGAIALGFVILPVILKGKL